MSQESKFRALTQANNVMVYGDLIHTPENTKRIIWFEIIKSDDIVDYKSFNEEVQSSTIGQFTGLTDKNGVNVYEHDILSEKWKVEVYKSIQGAYMVRFHTNPEKNKPMSLYEYLKKREKAGTSDRDCIVIGNIYQNPELIKN